MAFKSICGRLAACVVVGVLPLGASAQQTPNTEQIYQMILQQQERLQKLEADQGVLKSKAAAAEAQATQARQALMRTRQELQTTRQALEETRQAVRQPGPQGDAALMTARGAGAKFKTGFRLDAEGRYVHGLPNFSSFSGTLAGRPNEGIDTRGNAIETEEISFDGGGVRAGLGYVTDGGWDIGATYTGIFVRGSDQIGQLHSDLDNVFANGLSRTLADNAALNDNFDDGAVDFASQDIDLKQHVLDIDAGRHVAVTHDLRAFLFAGVRATNLRFDSDTLFANVETLLGATDIDHLTIDRQMTMTGAGLHFGSKFTYDIGDSGVYAFATPEMSLLYAGFDISRDEVAFNASLDRNNSSNFRTDMYSFVPVVEATMGFGYDGDGYFVKGGYTFSNWFGAIRTFETNGWDDIDDEITAIEIVQSDLTYGSFFVRGGARF